MFKVGQKVRVKTVKALTPLSRNNRKLGTLELPTPGWNSDMQELCGKTVHIKSVEEHLLYGRIYTIEEDDKCWCWTDWMFVTDCNDLVFGRLME